ncbi:MAG: glycosyltransferase [Thermoproteota archaeon]
MKILFASSSVGLGHIVRDVRLSNYMHWANITWITSGIALKYLEAKKVKIHEASYSLDGLDKIVEEMFKGGVLKISPNKLLKLYNMVKKNSIRLNELVNLDDFDGVVADEFWELLFLERPMTKNVFITDFLKFKPQTNSITQILLLPYVNKALHQKLKDFGAKIYVGLRPISTREFDFYGQIFTHEANEDCTERKTDEEDFILINLGGTSAGYNLLSKATPILNKLKLNVKVIGSSKHFTSNPLPYICRSKLIISMAGYSSLIELSRFKKKGIIVPLAGDFEQEDNARVFYDRPGYRILSFGKIEKLLERYILEIFNENPNPPIFNDGSEKISERLRLVFQSKNT